jgi:tetratricopeptide (TPR) repeat protein
MKKSLALAIVCMSLGGVPRAQAPGAGPLDTGWKAVQDGDASAAVTAFYEALRRNPKDAVAHFGAGMAAHMQGREDDAIASLTRALALEPRLVQASELMGRIQFQQGETGAAIKTYEQALTHDATNATLLGRLAEWRKEASVHAKLVERNDARFTIVFDGQADSSLASRATAVLDRAYYAIGQKIGAYPPNRVMVTLYTEQQFRDVTQAPAWAGGLFDGKIRVPVKGAAQNLAEFDHVLVHELTHAMIHGFAARGVPAWLHEGLASFFEPRDPAAAEKHMQRLGGYVIPLAALEQGFGRLDGNTATVAYAESLCAVDLLMHLVGGRMGVLLQGIGSGQSFDASLAQFGIRASDFEAQFGRRLHP